MFFINILKKKYLYQDSSIITKKIIQFFKKNKIKNNVILTFSNKSFEMYSSIFPILISGNIWVPLSINLPLEKIKNVVEQTNPSICFYDYQDKKILGYLKKKITCLKFKNVLSKKYKEKFSINDEISKLDLQSTAFIYFTSGSTGIPKGIKSFSQKHNFRCILSKKRNL